jgi:hypothetical protein
MSKEQRDVIKRVGSYLLEDPAGEVVRNLIHEIEAQEKRMGELEAIVAGYESSVSFRIEPADEGYYEITPGGSKIHVLGIEKKPPAPEPLDKWYWWCAERHQWGNPSKEDSDMLKYITDRYDIRRPEHE